MLFNLHYLESHENRIESRCGENEEKHMVAGVGCT